MKWLVISIVVIVWLYRHRNTTFVCLLRLHKAISHQSDMCDCTCHKGDIYNQLSYHK